MGNCVPGVVPRPPLLKDLFASSRKGSQHLPVFGETTSDFQAGGVSTSFLALICIQRKQPWETPEPCHFPSRQGVPRQALQLSRGVQCLLLRLEHPPRPSLSWWWRIQFLPIWALMYLGLPLLYHVELGKQTQNSPCNSRGAGSTHLCLYL